MRPDDPTLTSHTESCPCSDAARCQCKCLPRLIPQSHPRGQHGGFLLDFGKDDERRTIECYMPYVVGDSGEVLPFMPVEPTLDRAMIRAITGLSDAWINEQAPFWTARLPGWEVRVATYTWMVDVGFESMTARDETDAMRRRANQWRRSRAARKMTRRAHARVCGPGCQDREHLQQILRRLVKEYLDHGLEPR